MTTMKRFESHVGSFMWDLESYTKLMWRNPLQVVMIVVIIRIFALVNDQISFDKTSNVIQAIGADWVFEHENGTWSHRAEPR